MPSNPATVAIIGAGFGGLGAAKKLRSANLRVILIDRRNYHLFQPLLYQVATAGLSPTEIAHPIRAILRDQKNLDFRLAEVTGIDFNQKVIETTTCPVPYDYLILAAGSQTSYFGLDSIARHSFGLKNLDEASAIRSHILRQFELASQEVNLERKRQLLTFLIVGGGPTGVECAGAISELIQLVLVKDHPELNLKDVRVILLEATDRLLSNFFTPLQENASKILWDKHVEVCFGATVNNFDGNYVTLKSGEVIPANTLIWAAGVRAEEIADRLDVSQGHQGRIVVQPTLQLPDHPEVFVIGDIAYLEIEGQPLPMMAPVAIQQGVHAANNIIRLSNNQAPTQFQYKDPGALATIGRNAAVAQFGGLHFTGFLAWTLWLIVHIIQLIGFRNRLLVLINWAWDYFFYDRAVRIIMPEKCVHEENKP